MNRPTRKPRRRRPVRRPVHPHPGQGRRRATSIAMRRWKTAALSAVGIGVAFVLLEHGFRTGGTLRSVVGVGLIGLVIGALAAPEFAPELFPAPARWQAIVGAGGGALLALVVGATVPGIAAAAIAGGVLGALARHWVKHV